MVPDHAARPDVLPTERLLANGMAVPELRPACGTSTTFAMPSRCSRCGSTWYSSSGCVWLDAWWSYLLAFILMGPMYARFAILMHEAAHKLLFTNKKWNDWIGTWLIAYPVFTPVQLYRRVHFAPPQGRVRPGEPDMAFYRPYPCHPGCAAPPVAARRGRHLGLEELRPLVKNTATAVSGASAFPSSACRPCCGPCHGWPLGAGGSTRAWWLPWMTQWRVINRLRSIAEHGGMERNKDRRATSHNVRQSLPARFWFVPYNTGWHLAHHVDMGVPWRNCRPSMPNWSGPATSPTPSPTPPTAPCGRRSRAPRRGHSLSPGPPEARAA